MVTKVELGAGFYTHIAFANTILGSKGNCKLLELIKEVNINGRLYSLKPLRNQWFFPHHQSQRVGMIVPQTYTPQL